LQVFAGTGIAGYNGDNIAAQQAWIWEPNSVFIDATASYLYFADVNNARVRRISMSASENYLISTIAGGSKDCTFTSGVSATTVNLILRQLT
jgi:hypothetical protein